MITKMVSCQHVLYIGNQSLLDLPVNFSAALTLMSTTILKKTLKKNILQVAKQLKILNFCATLDWF